MVVRRDPTMKHYRFVGECYIHGIMHGEVVVSPHCKEETIELV